MDVVRRLARVVLLFYCLWYSDWNGNGAYLITTGDLSLIIGSIDLYITQST
ncbi:MAG: hypothetical protein ACI8RD_005581 [Bacillariaceae sp.]|jgi:hypothetical protein